MEMAGKKEMIEDKMNEISSLKSKIKTNREAYEKLRREMVKRNELNEPIKVENSTLKNRMLIINELNESIKTENNTLRKKILRCTDAVRNARDQMKAIRKEKE